MDYLKVYREMISLRGLTDHTVKSYSTYIRSYLDYLQTVLLNNQRMFPGMNSGILSVGCRRNVRFPTGQSMPVSRSSAFLPYMSFTDPGIQLNSPCEGLILIFPMSLLKKKRIFLFPLSQT